MTCHFVVHPISGYSSGPLKKAGDRARAAGKKAKKFPVSRRGFNVATKYATRWQGTISLDCGRIARGPGGGTAEATIQIATCRKQKGKKTSTCGLWNRSASAPPPIYRSDEYRAAERMVLAGRKQR